MAYATIADMLARYGEGEMIRLSAADGGLDGGVDTVRTQRSLDEATALIDGYLRARYDLPLSPVPLDVRAACCTLARYDLAQGDQKTPSEQMRLDRKAAIDWLTAISKGDVQLPATTTTIDGSAARVSDRTRRVGGLGTLPADDSTIFRY